MIKDSCRFCNVAYKFSKKLAAYMAFLFLVSVTWTDEDEFFLGEKEDKEMRPWLTEKKSILRTLIQC